MTPSKIFNAKPVDFVIFAGQLYGRLLVKTLIHPKLGSVPIYQHVRWHAQRASMIPRDRRQLRLFRQQRARLVKIHLQTQPHPQPAFVS